MATLASTFEFTDRDHYKVFVYRWEPAQPAKAAVQIEHGAGEHALRYQRVAEFLNDHGYDVYANDHRGHGRTAGSMEAAGKAGMNFYLRKPLSPSALSKALAAVAASARKEN